MYVMSMEKTAQSDGAGLPASNSNRWAWCDNANMSPEEQKPSSEKRAATMFFYDTTIK